MNIPHELADELPIEEAYRRYYVFVRSIVYGRLRNGDDADDIAQAIFIKLSARPELFGGCKLKNWLARVARNAALDKLREKHRIWAPLSETYVPCRVPKAFAWIISHLRSDTLRWILLLRHCRLPNAKSSICGISAV